MFQSRGVHHPRNVLEINGNPIFGGLPVCPSDAEWNANVMLVHPGVLNGSGNTLHIEARNANGGGGSNLDDFIIDNVIVMYKTN